MSGHRAHRREYPAFAPGATPVSQDFENSPTHGNKSAAFRRLAVRNENQTIFPVEILNPHPVEFALISHSRIAHQDDHVAKEIARSLSPTTVGSCSEQLGFGGIIESE